MILTDREIRISIERGLIHVKPVPSEDAYSSTAVDLTLDNQFRVFRRQAPGVSIKIDPGAPGYNFAKAATDLTEVQIIDEAKGYDFLPGSLLLAWTTETVELQPEARLAARVEGKSSLARLGLGVHITAPTIHAGFSGQIQLEMINHGPVPIVLRPKMKICQLIFEQTSGVPDSAYSGQFKGQSASGNAPKRGK